MGVIQHMVDREIPQHIIEAAKPVGTDEEHGGGAHSPLPIKAFFGHFLLWGVGNLGLPQQLFALFCLGLIDEIYN